MRLLTLVFVFAAGFYVYNAAAESLLVHTTSRSAAGVTVRSSLQVVDIETRRLASRVAPMPAQRMNAVSILASGDDYALTTSSDDDNMLGGRSYFRAFSLPALHPLPRADMLSLPNWRYMGTALGREVNGATPLIATLALVPINEVAFGGHLDIFRWNSGAARPLNLQSPLRLLPGPPVDWVNLKDGHTLVVLCKHPTRPRAIVHSLSLATDQVASMASLELGEYQLGSAPSGIALSEDGRFVFALTSGYALQDPGGELTSWLHTLNSETLQPVGPAITVPGVVRPREHALVPSGAATCWIATPAPGADFAYATRVRATDSGSEIVAHAPLTGAFSAPRIAVEPKTESIAVGVGRRLEIWDSGLPGETTQAYAGRVGALLWNERGLYLGEGSRVHRIDRDTGLSDRVVQLQSGFVEEILALADKTTPGSTAGRYALDLPSTVTFHGEAAGHELRSIQIGDTDMAGTRWRIDYDEAEMPWLRIFPTEGTGPGRVTMGIDPVEYLSDVRETVVGFIDVFLEETASAPTRVYIQIAPDRNALRRVLWIWPETGTADAAGPQSFSGLMDLLAAPPLRFSHREVRGTAPEDLEQFVAVVLGTDVAARGALTRQALLDYAASGGALLVLGSHSDTATSNAFRRWLEPIGIRLDTAARVDGAFGEIARHELCRNWSNFTVRAGCRIQVSAPATSLVAHPDHADASVFAQSGFGLGRIAVLSAPTPLENSAIENTSNARFASDVFRWLARARTEIDDQDGDGLRDDIEDTNGNGIRDPGETNYLDPDTDDDGVPDRFEDLNRNGAIDESETSPLNPDSEGDGIFDGADDFPLPPIDAPVIASVEPETGPSEGGTFVVVHGRNFDAETKLWFGDRRSALVRVIDSTQLVAQTPPHVADVGGSVQLRAVNASTALRGALPNGYTYGARSTVGVKLKADEPVLVSFNPATPKSQIYEGNLAITLDVPDVALGHISLLIRAEPADALQVIYFDPASRAAGMSQNLRGRRIDGDMLQIDLPPWALIDAGNEIGKIHWQSRRGAVGQDLVFSLAATSFTAGNGIPLQSAGTPEPARVRIPAATP